ncbi:MAG: M55 family metallopeptidase [Ignavibacteria bacterium]|jgi:D-amino peptidase
MKIYISLDMEGIAGTFSWTQEENNRAEVRKCISQQVEWVLEGIRSSSVNVTIEEIVIADSHSAGDNLLYEITALDDRLHLISGFPRANYMMPAFDKTYSIVFFVGYHGGIGTMNSVMDHSYTPRFHRIWINEKPMNESLINGAYAGYFRVPVGLVIGDDALCGQLKKKDCMPWVEFVTTKYSLGRFAVKNKPLQIVQKETQEAVKKVLDSDVKMLPLYKFDPPIKLKIEFQTTSMADVVSMVPDIKRLDGFTVEFTHNDFREVFDATDAFATLARSVKW